MGTKHTTETGGFLQNYIIGRTLGKGATGRVMECTERNTSIKYALKIMLKSKKNSATLFNRETTVLNELSHRNIVVFKDDFQDRENFYIFTEMCSGGELCDRIVDVDFDITEAYAAKLVRSMLLAIQHCHQKQVVHRDLKPENFVFKTPAKDSELVLIDFGSAMIVQDSVVYTESVGSPLYLAPENSIALYHRTGRTLKSSDLWSIGIIAYTLMIGRPPFNGKTNNEILTRIVTKPLELPENLHLSPDFTSFIKEILTKSPDERLCGEDALEHSWVDLTKIARKQIPETVIKTLRQFNRQSKMKKAITEALVGNMDTQPEGWLRAHFNSIDTNKDGMLSPSEIAVLLIDLGYSVHSAFEEAEKITLSADENHSGEIDFEEFSQKWQRMLLSTNDAYIHAVFNVLDTNGDGKIDLTELGGMLGLGDFSRLETLVKEVDTNGDGVIDFAEFRAAMTENGYFCGEGAEVGQKLKQEDLLDQAVANDDLKISINQ